MKIAVIGGGLAGVAVSWHLQQVMGAEITLFDPLGIGGGTSGIAAGLLHPFVGQTGKLNWLGWEGFQATVDLLRVAGLEELGRGMLRPALDPKAVADFKECAEKNSSVTWVEDLSQLVSGCVACPGILIPDAITIPTKSYLKGLWRACEERGASFVCQEINDLSEVENFDVVVLATGAALTLHSEKLTPVKGQLLEFVWPSPSAPIPFPVSGPAYLLKDPEGANYLAGATYEHTFSTEKPDAKIAKTEIKEKLQAFLPSTAPLQICAVRSGIRASTPDRKPLLKRLSKRCWILAGFGSKGLLYHALFAKKLALEVVASLSIAQAFRDEHMGFSGKVKEENNSR